MVHSEPMAARERVFTIRLSGAEADMVERVAKSFSLPIAGLFRMLVKKESDRLELQMQVATDEIELEDLHRHILDVMPDAGESLGKWEIQARLCDAQYGYSYNIPGGGREIGGLSRALNELVRGKYLRRLRTSARDEIGAYVITQKGEAVSLDD